MTDLPKPKHTYRPGELIDLGIDLEATFDPASALTINQAAKLLHGRRGRGVHREVCRRFANPRRGCQPQGEHGPRLVLPAVKIGGGLYVMPQWVELFERVRMRLGQQWRTRSVVLRADGVRG